MRVFSSTRFAVSLALVLGASIALSSCKSDARKSGATAPPSSAGFAADVPERAAPAERSAFVDKPDPPPRAEPMEEHRGGGRGW